MWIICSLIQINEYNKLSWINFLTKLTPTINNNKIKNFLLL